MASHLDETGLDEGAYLAALRSRRAREVARGASAFGPHRDDLQVVERQADGRLRDLRLFGSQGEQRAAVLALLLAERAVAEEATGDLGTLFLDDVMSELDDARRRLLARVLNDGGQSIITTTNLLYFTGEELAGARVIELPLLECAGEGAAGRGDAGSRRPADAVRPGPTPARGHGCPARRASPRRRTMPEPRRLGDVLAGTLKGVTSGRPGARLLGLAAGRRRSQVAAVTRPRRFARGTLTVGCESSVWANELTYLTATILEKMAAVDAGHPVKRLRFEAVGSSVRQGDEPPASNLERGRRKLTDTELDEALRRAAELGDEGLRAAVRAALAAALERPREGGP